MSVRYERMPLAELMTPRNGRVVLLNHWWAVTEDECALFYCLHGAFAPQCNVNRSIVERIGPPDTKPKFIAVAYVPAKAMYDV